MKIIKTDQGNNQNWTEKSQTNWNDSYMKING